MLMRAHDMNTTMTASDVEAKLERALHRLQSAGQQVALDETRAEEQVQGVYESGQFPGASDYGAHIPVEYSVENMALEAALRDEPLPIDNNNIPIPSPEPSQQNPVRNGDEGPEEDYVSHAPTAEQQPAPQLERRFWFAGDCANSNAAVQLLANRPDGTFLIRPSTNCPNAPYTLSVVYVKLYFIRFLNGIY